MKKIVFIFLVTIGFAGLQAQTRLVSDSSDYCPGVIVYEDLYEALENPEQVVKLDISMQKLTKIPPEIAKLTNLECLDLSFNRFSDLPQELKQLKKLRYINLAGTRFLMKAPSVLREIPSLEIIDLRDHPEWSEKQYAEAEKMLSGKTVIR